MRELNRKNKIVYLSFVYALISLFSLSVTSYASKNIWGMWNSKRTKIDVCSAGPDLSAESKFSALLEAQSFYNDKEFDSALKNLDSIINIYGEKAKEMQNSLTEKPWMSKEDVFKYKELNAVGTALLIKALIYYKFKEFDKAKVTLNDQINNYAFAQCWNPKGWFVSQDVLAEELLEEMK